MFLFMNNFIITYKGKHGKILTRDSNQNEFQLLNEIMRTLHYILLL